MPDALSAASVLAGRGIRISRRNLDAVITSMMLPIMLMLVFVYFFGGAIDTGTRYVTYVVPGVLVLCAGFGAASTAVTVSEDMRLGVVDRFRTLDVGGTPFLAGHVAATVTRNVLSTALVLGAAFAIGFRPAGTAAGWLAAIGLLLAWITAVSWLSAALGLVTKTAEAAGAITFFMMFLPYPSSAFVPIETMPSWLHGFAEHQPVTPLIESMRGLLLGQPAGDAPWIALAWCAGLLALALAASGYLFRLRTR
ncbi:transport permease protein [Streptomyces cinereoruber]|uniref:Transport permease protein n=1 Tax=Streptomyces cinereoruber TaxID=67260 RepID=A0AAV4KHU1_9ACTN|nr:MULTISPECIES: ABC transporter permease [Streptomyces]AVH96295.1 multidrug ABC transporter permease [Streptomyces sp. WAC00288]KYG54950.1 multidrug ABC transporter permease [Streptomyces sp. WAC04657]MBB4156691.1 ABC-2 type transport system permease protein [Streptomyces cinereoruber]MBY8815477.1 ABC transporter permease [Streptomyces cinereoruber]NIH60211.1 ABC-2 type transport system permease protein [Streptomyces cinereoruber]